METVTETLELDVPPGAVRECIREDVPRFIEASGFDSVDVEGDQITVSRSIGLATLELTLEVVEADANAVLALDQTEGIFDRMWTEYLVEPNDGGSRVTARTEFTLGRVLGPVLDASVIAKQRRAEFEDQFEYLVEQLSVEA